MAGRTHSGGYSGLGRDAALATRLRGYDQRDQNIADAAKADALEAYRNQMAQQHAEALAFQQQKAADARGERADTNARIIAHEKADEAAREANASLARHKADMAEIAASQSVAMHEQMAQDRTEKGFIPINKLDEYRIKFPAAWNADKNAPALAAERSFTQKATADIKQAGINALQSNFDRASSKLEGAYAEAKNWKDNAENSGKPLSPTIAGRIKTLEEEVPKLGKQLASKLPPEAADAINNTVKEVANTALLRQHNELQSGLNGLSGDTLAAQVAKINPIKKALGYQEIDPKTGNVPDSSNANTDTTALEPATIDELSGTHSPKPATPPPAAPTATSATTAADATQGPAGSAATVADQPANDDAWSRRDAALASNPPADATVVPEAAPKLNPIQDTHLQAYRDAIAKGAPVDVIAQRLKEKGYDPSPLLATPSGAPTEAASAGQ